MSICKCRTWGIINKRYMDKMKVLNLKIWC